MKTPLRHDLDLDSGHFASSYLQNIKQECKIFYRCEVIKTQPVSALFFHYFFTSMREINKSYAYCVTKSTTILT